MDLKHLFQTENPILGVVHLLPLPTSARWGGDLRKVMDRAEQEATALAAGGIDGIIIENFFDAPFTKQQVDPATIAAMTLIMDRLSGLVTIPLGLNVLRNDAKSAMAIAACTGAKFIRVNVLTGVMATDQGLIEGNAHELLKYRRELDADVAILADVLVKHAHPVSTPDLPAAIHDTVERGLADAIILSGWATGHAPKMDDIKDARSHAGDTPILIGSGTDWENIGNLLQVADGAIVASSLKRHGDIKQPIDPLRVSQLMESAQQGIKIRQMRQKQFA